MACKIKIDDVFQNLNHGNLLMIKEKLLQKTSNSQILKMLFHF